MEDTGFIIPFVIIMIFAILVTFFIKKTDNQKERQSLQYQIWRLEFMVKYPAELKIGQKVNIKPSGSMDVPPGQTAKVIVTKVSCEKINETWQYCHRYFQWRYEGTQLSNGKTVYWS